MSNPSVKNDPSTRSTSGSRSRHEPRRRLNLRAVLILAVFALVAVPAFFLAKSYQDHRQGSALLAEAKKLLNEKPPEPNLALTYLNRHLELNPQDVDALDLKAKTLYGLVRSVDQAMGALASTEQVVRTDPLMEESDKAGKKTGEKVIKRPEARRRLVRLYLSVGKFQTANTVAKDLVDSKTRTAEDYRLLGSTYMTMGRIGAQTAAAAGGQEVDVWREAIKYYEQSHELEPGNVEGARNLAYLYQARAQAPEKAAAVLDRLLENSRTDAEKTAARVARHEHFASYAEPGKPDTAAAELAEAVRLSPSNPDVLLRAAMDALRRGDTDTARRRIEAIPQEKRTLGATNVDVHTIEGMIDVRENKIDKAIEDWQAGLLATGGVSESLTWRLAFVFLRLGRTAEARPLVEQYHRLTETAVGPTPKAVFLDALIDLNTNRPDEAIEKLEPIRLKTAEKSTSQGGDESLGAWVAYTLGQAFEAKGDPQKALDAYHQAAVIVRANKGLKWADPWVAAARVKQLQGKLLEATSELEDGLITMPGDPNLLIALGRVLFTQESRKSNKEKRSWTALEKVLEQGRHADPGSVDLIKLQIPYLEATGRLDKAAELLEAATDPQHHPRNPDLWTLRAEVLRRLGRKEQALEVLERGTAAVGEQALLRMAQAQVLISLGREKAAYDTLTQGVRIVPADQRPMILKAVGDLHRRLNDPAAARKAYAEWAKLAPKDPQPHLMILELALAADDGRAIKEEVAALDAIGGVSRPMAEALVLLRDSPGDDKDARAKRLDEAEAKVRKVIEVAPGLPIGYRLLGRLMEQRGDVDKALEAYRQAREKNGGPDVLRDLFVLLARQKRFDELRRLRAELHTGELTPELEQVAAGIALATGAKDVAFDMMQQVVRGDPQGLDTRLWQVNVLNALGKPEEAEKILQGLIQQRPEALDPRIALMMLQLNQKQPLEAAKTVEQIRTQAKTERPEFVWAGCYAILGNLAEAGKYYKASLQKWPNDQDVRQRVVAFFRGSGQVDEAEVTLRQILKAEPNHAWAKRELAQILSARRNDAAAWNEALKLIGTEPAGTDTAEDRLVRATVLARSPDPDRQRDAIRILDGLAADSPGAIAALAHELLARIYTDSNQLDKAREHAEKVANRFSDPNAIAFYIDLLLRAKQVDEAERQLDRLAKLEPDSPRVLALRVAAMQAQGRAKEAASWLETTYEAHRKAPDGELLGRKAIDLLVGLGQPEAAERVGRGLAEDWPKSAWAVASVLARRGQLEEALKYCQKAAAAGNAVEAGTAAALLITSQTLGADAQARLAQAVPLLDAALKQQPDNFTLLFSRAGLLRRQGRFDEAAKLYSDLLAKGASNSFVLNNLAWTLSEDLNQPAAGLEKIDAAIQATGPSPSLLDTRGVILTRLGRYDDAVKDLEAATQKTHSASQHYHLARAYHKAGRAEESRKNLDRAKQAGLVPAQLEPGERAEMQKLMKP